jgi:hypothetical protein
MENTYNQMIKKKKKTVGESGQVCERVSLLSSFSSPVQALAFDKFSTQLQDEKTEPA